MYVPHNPGHQLGGNTRDSRAIQAIREGPRERFCCMDLG